MSMTASDVRILSRQEILRLQLMGQITPISKIPQERKRGRVFVPPEWDRGRYCRGRRY